MNVLVLGGGGREHAIVWKLRQSSEVAQIYCSPGNGGTAHLATNIPTCAENDWTSYADFVLEKRVDLTVVGPELPLSKGIVDIFRKKGLLIFGPDKASAQLESSKIFAKKFMRKHGIPTANCKILEHLEEARNFLSNLSLTTFRFPLVVKADGLAQGKGVIICNSKEETQAAIEKMMVKKVFGAAGEKILIEEKLEGEEISLLAFCDGKTIRMLPPARDFKRAYDGNLGPNTGGMGSIAPVPLPAAQIMKIEQHIVNPFLKGIQNENLDYKGVIYFGLMLTAKGPYALEFNVRFGDPETQSLLPLLENDLSQVFLSTALASLDKMKLKISQDSCVGVVLASGGYPETVLKELEIHGLESLPEDSNRVVFHAGTNSKNGKIFTSGGRVLNVVGRGSSLEAARKNCYEAIRRIEFDGMHYRKDIGTL